jgi:hypothetical protein
VFEASVTNNKNNILSNKFFNIIMIISEFQS